ncbi:MULTISPECIES: hypothetical protein [unclassified Pseudoalteromonas]|uniref:hypothetical protein n=1 Tax=unclassified Pseudoalteromonas TaxID=194690 RepID=UPI0030144959
MRYILVTCVLATLLGCAEEHYDEQQATQQQKAINLQNEKSLIGGWESDNVQIEFHSSHYNRVFPNQGIQQSQVKTGRYIESGQIYQFHWSLENSGLITINVIDNTCTIVPVDYCEVKSRKLIELTGNDVRAAQWEISSDRDLDGVIDDTVSINLTRTSLAELTAVSGKFFLKQSKNFDNPIITKLIDNQVSVSLPISASSTHRYSTFLGNLSSAEEVLPLAVQDSNRITDKRWFEVSGQTDTQLEVETTVSDVVLRKGVDDSYIIDYLIQREIKFPESLTEDMLDLSEFRKLQRYTILFSEMVSLRNDFNVNFNETYYSKLPAGFVHSADGAGSEVLFNADNTGSITFTDPSNMTENNEQSFTWQYKNDQEMLIELASGAAWNMGFTGTVLGGSSVVFYNESNETYSHDFLTKSYVEPSSLLPGRFKLENTDGLSLVDVDFKNNGEIEINAGPISFSGFWVITNEGDVVSFECDKKDGSVVTELDRCLELMAQIGTSENELAFGHIRKFTFLHRAGNKLVSTYNATAWGEPFTTGVEPVHFNWVYRWKRKGDNH